MSTHRWSQIARRSAAAIAILLSFVIPLWAAEIKGTVNKVVDGDTFWICDPAACHKIRLCGVDAPELEDLAGPASKRALEDMIGSQIVTCVPVGEGTVCDGRSKPTSYDRIVAQCFVAGQDIAGAMVDTGHACDWVRYSGGHYSRGPGRAVCER